MDIRFILAATLVLNFTTTANASLNFKDEDKSFLTSEDFVKIFHVTLRS